jgi:hypothetical protein
MAGAEVQFKCKHVHTTPTVINTTTVMVKGHPDISTAAYHQNGNSEGLKTFTINLMDAL